MSNKDPAFLFYPSDFLTGTMLMADDQIGKYIKLLCFQHQRGHLSEKQMLQICQSYDEDIFVKFTKDEHGLYFNERLDEEIQKRRKYSESRSKNRLSKKEEKDMSDICQSHDEHMENVNENINKDIKVIKKDIYKEYCNENEELLTAFKNWEEMRKDNKAKMTDQMRKLSITAIEKITLDPKKQIEIINHATLNCWKSFYPLKEQQSSNPFKDKLKEMVEDERNRSNGDHVGYQGGLSKLLQEPNRD